MIIYLFNLIWSVIMSVLSVKYSKLEYNSILKTENKMPNKFFVILILFSLMSFYALRWRTGTDFGNYYSFYFHYGKLDISEIVGTRDWGFYALTSFIYKIWPDNFVFYNYILSALTYIPIILTYRKYSKRFTFTIFLFITMMIYYSPYNGVRQGIAASFCFCAYPYLYEKRYIKYSIIIVIASLFHSTALIMIPLIFIVNKKPWSKSIIIVILLLVISILILPSLWNYIINFLEAIGQEKMANDYRTYNYDDDGVHLLRILVDLIPVLISYIFYKKLSKEDSKIDVIINMCLFGLIFTIFGTRLTVLARLSGYFSFYYPMLVPEFTVLFKEKSKHLYKVIVVLLYFLYMLKLLPVDSNLLPYRFIFLK